MKNETGIYGFNGKYRFLSNFAPAKVILDEVEYPTTEHAYQAAKTLDASDRRKIRNAETPGEAKKLGRKLKVRPDWDKVKFDIMEDLVRQKFTKHDDLKRALLNTEDFYIEESNHWQDVYWGVCNGKGENHLGKIIMKIREELKNG